MSSPPRILLVDDEAGILSSLRRSLRREGYELITAESAGEALGVLADERVDLIVSDQKMPGMSGIDFLAEVSRRHGAVPGILLTGWPEEIAPARLRELGIRALLPKPWDDAELKATLRKNLPAH